MVTRRLGWTVLSVAIAAGALAYLRDPPWLIGQSSGLRGWVTPAGDLRYRWSGGHASFFVRSDLPPFDLPLSTTFDEKDSRPMMVTVSIDDVVAARVVLTDASWRRVRITLPPPGSRRVRRIDVRTSVTREDNHGVRIAEPEPVPRAPVAGKLLRDTGGGETTHAAEVDRYRRGALRRVVECRASPLPLAVRVPRPAAREPAADQLARASRLWRGRRPRRDGAAAQLQEVRAQRG